MSGRRVIVTGASSGIGEATSLLLARAGDSVILASRRLDATEAAAARIRARVPGARVEAARLDLASLRSVRAFARAVSERHATIDALVHDAGLVTERRELTEDGFERILAVDVLGPFLLTSLLLPRLRSEGRAARIVQLAGIYHRHGEIELDDLHFARRTWALGPVNAQAQLARVVLTVELARRLRASERTINAVHPGAVRTHAQDRAPLWAKLLMATVAAPVFVDAEEGAWPVVHLVGAPELEGVSGRFFDRLHEAPLVAAAADPALGAALFTRVSQLVDADPIP